MKDEAVKLTAGGILFNGDDLFVSSFSSQGSERHKQLSAQTQRGSNKEEECSRSPRQWQRTKNCIWVLFVGWFWWREELEGRSFGAAHGRSHGRRWKKSSYYILSVYRYNYSCLKLGTCALGMSPLKWVKSFKSCLATLSATMTPVAMAESLIREEGHEKFLEWWVHRWTNPWCQLISELHLTR